MTDPINHGTPVHGVAAGEGNNEVGISGVGWSLRHRLIQAGNVADTIDEWEVAASVGDIVLVSTIGPHGGQQTWKMWDDSSKALYTDYEVLIFMSAGNREEDESHIFPYMVIVGGTDTVSDEILDNPGPQGSAFGAFIDVMAPATHIFSSVNTGDDDYDDLNSGTSFSAPMTAGLAALLWSYDKSLPADEVRDFIYDGCDAFVGYVASQHGHGRINVFNSLALASGELWTLDPVPGNAGVTNKFKAAGATDGATVTFYDGTSTGSTSVPGCIGLNVDIASAQILGTATAGSNGSAILSASVPSNWSGQTVYLQCVGIVNCRKSNLVTYTFP